MDTRQLAAFCAVVELRSFSQAAERLGVTQPAVSLQIRALEHRFAGRPVTVDELAGEPLIVMQEGAGVRQVVEDALKPLGTKLRNLDVRLELGLQESVRSAVQAGYGVSFISRAAVESELAAGTIAEARVEGMDASREISLVRGPGRSPTRAPGGFIAFSAP